MRTDYLTSGATVSSVAFTGHRKIRAEHLDHVRTCLASAIVRLYEYGCRDFYCGMAMGFDLLAAETVIGLKSVCPQIRLVAAIPFPGQERSYSDADKTRYRNALSFSDERVVLSDRYGRNAYRIRNTFMIEHASHVIAYYDTSVRYSGTGQTMRMAEKKGCHITNLFLQE